MPAVARIRWPYLRVQLSLIHFQIGTKSPSALWCLSAGVWPGQPPCTTMHITLPHCIWQICSILYFIIKVWGVHDDDSDDDDSDDDDSDDDDWCAYYYYDCCCCCSCLLHHVVVLIKLLSIDLCCCSFILCPARIKKINKNNANGK